MGCHRAPITANIYGGTCVSPPPPSPQRSKVVFAFPLRFFFSRMYLSILSINIHEAFWQTQEHNLDDFEKKWTATILNSILSVSFFN